MTIRVLGKSKVLLYICREKSAKKIINLHQTNLGDQYSPTLRNSEKSEK